MKTSSFPFSLSLSMLFSEHNDLTAVLQGKRERGKQISRSFKRGTKRNETKKKNVFFPFTGLSLFHSSSLTHSLSLTSFLGAPLALSLSSRSTKTSWQPHRQRRRSPRSWSPPRAHSRRHPRSPRPRPRPRPAPSSRQCGRFPSGSAGRPRRRWSPRARSSRRSSAPRARRRPRRPRRRRPSGAAGRPCCRRAR